MTERKEFTVTNIRPRRTVSLYGRVLAPKGTGRTSQMELTEEQLLGDPCVRLLKTSRIAVIRGEIPPSLHAALVGAEPVASPSPAEPVPPLEQPKVEEVPPAPVVETPEPVEELEVSDLLLDTTKVWTAEDLAELSYQDVQIVAKSRGLKTSGKETTIIKRILAAQEPSSPTTPDEP